MDPITAAIDEAYEMAAKQRQRGGNLLGAAFFEDAFQELDGWRDEYQRRVVQFLGNWRPDRADTDAQLRERFKGAEHAVWVGDVFDLWQEQAQVQIEQDLIANGLHADSAHKVVKTYQIAAYR
jgi:hypothetical protein